MAQFTIDFDEFLALAQRYGYKRYAERSTRFRPQQITENLCYPGEVEYMRDEGSVRLTNDDQPDRWGVYISNELQLMAYMQRWSTYDYTRRDGKIGGSGDSAELDSEN